MLLLSLALVVLLGAVAIQERGPQGEAPEQETARPVTPGEARVFVPDVVGLPPGDAVLRVEASGLRAIPDVPAGADPGLVAAGRVTVTDPSPGSRVSPGTTVTLSVTCVPTCAAPRVSASETAACEYPGTTGAPVVDPTRVRPGGEVRIDGPAFSGEPLIRVFLGPRSEVQGPDAREVVSGSARPAPDCLYSLAFFAPGTPGEYSIFIVIDPPARIEPPFDLTVAS